MKLRIEKFSLENFRGIRKILVKYYHEGKTEESEYFEFGDINVFVGPNNSGKTSIALALACVPAIGSPLPEPLERLYGSTRGAIFRMMNISEQYIPFNYGSLNETKVAIYYKLNNVDSIVVHEITYLTATLVKLNSREVRYHELLDPDTPYKIFPFFELGPSTLERLFNYLFEKWDGLGIEAKGLHIGAANYLNKFSDEQYEMIFPKHTYLAAITTSGRIGRRVTDLGIGLQETLIMYILTKLFDIHIIIWDDFGSHMHPTLISNLMNLFIENNIQVIVTTHSLDVIFSLLYLPENIDVRLFKLRRLGNGLLVSECLTREQIEDEIFVDKRDPRKAIEHLGI